MSIYHELNSRPCSNYVYILFRSIPHYPGYDTPFYVGKGIGNRVEDHVKSVQGNWSGYQNAHKNNIINQHLNINIPINVLYVEVPTIEVANMLEQLLITFHGRSLDGGCLSNIGLGGEGGGQGMSTAIKIDQFDLRGNFIHTYNSINEAARQVSGCSSVIRDIIYKRKNVKRHKGFFWTISGDSLDSSWISSSQYLHRIDLLVDKNVQQSFGQYEDVAKFLNRKTQSVRSTFASKPMYKKGVFDAYGYSWRVV